MDGDRPLATQGGRSSRPWWLRRGPDSSFSGYSDISDIAGNAFDEVGRQSMDAKSAARTRVDSARDDLIELSHRIHAHPELGFEEERASAWLCDSLTDAGFTVEQGICDLPTAFRATGDPDRST